LDHVGVLARSVYDVQCVFERISGHDPRDPATSRASPFSRGAPESLEGKTAALLVESIETADDEIARAVRRAADLLGNIGMKVVDLSIPLSRHADATSLAISSAEAGMLHRKWLAERPQDYGPDVRVRLQTGAMLPAEEYARALELRKSLIIQFAAVWREIDVLLAPTVPIVAPRLEDSDRDEVISRLTAGTRLFNVLGVPACSVPCPGTALPIGMTIASAPQRDAIVLDTALAYEKAAFSVQKS
jgi:aspartyl-tRNA(Asn)/glutamyl-tRNA(Gln) amidotransferase subunit A